MKIKKYEQYINENKDVSTKAIVNTFISLWPEYEEFLNNYIERFPTEEDHKNRMWDYLDIEEEDTTYEDAWYPDAEVHMLETEFGIHFEEDDFADMWVEFYNVLVDAGW